MIEFFIHTLIETQLYKYDCNYSPTLIFIRNTIFVQSCDGVLADQHDIWGGRRGRQYYFCCSEVPVLPTMGTIV